MRCNTFSRGWNKNGRYIFSTIPPSSYNKWINLHIFKIHLLLLFTTAYFWCNEKWLFLLWNIPTPYCWQKKKEVQAKWPLFVIRCHSLSLVAIRCHSLFQSLSLVAIRCTTRHSLSLDLSLVSLVYLFINDPRKTSKDQKKKLIARTKLKLFKENVEYCFSKFNLCLY